MPPPIHKIQPTFAGGEFTPALYGRVDISKYQDGLRRARNVNVLPQGGVRNRAGTQYVATVKDSSKAVRLIPFVVSRTVAYILELGDQYMRFYTSGAQVLSGMSAYEISTPWAAADLASLKFAQSAGIMYFAHPSYAPQQLTYTSSASWALASFAFVNGPFRLRNTDTSKTLTASALTGSITLTAASALFDTSAPSKHINALFEMVWTVVGQTITPSITASVKNWIPTKATWQATTTGTWSGTILIQTSPDNITWTTVSTVTSNGVVSGTASFTDGYLRAIMQSSLAFSGTATVALVGNGDTTGAVNLGAVNAATSKVPAGDTATITITGIGVQTIKLQKSTDDGATWSDLASYTTNQAATVVATGETACHIRALCSAYTSGGPAVTTVNGGTGAAPTLSPTISTASVSAAIQCGQNWNAITTGAWTGKLRIEVSTDGGSNWSIVQTFQSSGSNNFNTSGQSGTSQCLLRVSSDPTVAFSGTATIDLTSSSFDWVGVVKITAVASSTSATATVQSLSNSNSTGLANTSATYQWSEGSWSTYRGWPSCVSFFQERLCFGGTPNSEPSTGWASKVDSFTDFGVSSPLVDSDSLSFVLPSRQLNAIQNMIVMPTALVCLTSDSEWSIAPGSGGVFSPTSVSINYQGSRGSANAEPVVVGNELILIQQMGTVVRNLIFQLAVNGFFGDNISLISQHLFTNYQIVALAYQQEPDSLVWAVRSDGKLLSLTYLREQEVQAWTWHDTQGSFESLAVIPNTTTGINEVWFVVNRTINGATKRFVERLRERDQGTDVTLQFFVDAGLQYSGAATNSFTIAHLPSTAISVLADGNVITGITTDGSGNFTLAVAAAKVTAGLKYVSDVETLKIEAPDQRGTLQGRYVVIPKVTLRFIDSRSGYVGGTRPTDDGVTGLDPILQRGPSDALNVAIPMKSTDYQLVPKGGYNRDAHMIYRQVDPLPFTLLGFMPQVVAGES